MKENEEIQVEDLEYTLQSGKEVVISAPSEEDIQLAREMATEEFDNFSWLTEQTKAMLLSQWRFEGQDIQAKDKIEQEWVTADYTLWVFQQVRGEAQPEPDPKAEDAT